MTACCFSLFGHFLALIVWSQYNLSWIVTKISCPGSLLARLWMDRNFHICLKPTINLKVLADMLYVYTATWLQHSVYDSTTPHVLFVQILIVNQKWVLRLFSGPFYTCTQSFYIHSLYITRNILQLFKDLISQSTSFLSLPPKHLSQCFAAPMYSCEPCGINQSICLKCFGWIPPG